MISEFWSKGIHNIKDNDPDAHEDRHPRRGSADDVCFFHEELAEVPDSAEDEDSDDQVHEQVCEDAAVEIGVEQPCQGTRQDGGESCCALEDVGIFDDVPDVYIPCVRPRVHFSVRAALSFICSLLGRESPSRGGLLNTLGGMCWITGRLYYYQQIARCLFWWLVSDYALLLYQQI